MDIHNYIDFNYRKYNTTFIIAIMIIIISHIIHFFNNKKYLYIFYLGFIISYILFLTAEYQLDNNINIVMLFFRLTVIFFLFLAFLKEI